MPTSLVGDQPTIAIPATDPIPNHDSINAHEIVRVHDIIESIAPVLADAGFRAALESIAPNRDTNCYEVTLEAHGQRPTHPQAELVRCLEQFANVVTRPKQWAKKQLERGSNNKTIKRYLSHANTFRKSVETDTTLHLTDSGDITTVSMKPRAKAVYKEAKSLLNPPAKHNFDSIEVKLVASFGDNYLVSSKNEPLWSRDSRLLQHLKKCGHGRYSARREKRTIEVWALVERLNDTDVDSQSRLDF